MSMNLHLKVDDQEIDLWQTPTSITHMCLVNHNFEIQFEVEGEAALRAIAIYTTWVRSTLNGIWDDEEDLRTHQVFVSDHISDIKNAVTKGHKVNVYQL